jgi:hypothetical protein
MHLEILENISISLIKREMTCLHGNLSYFNQMFLKESS